MSRIAIIGLSGAGKTVLTVSLAKFLASPDNPTGATLEPTDLKTHTYVEKTWAILRDGSWPPSTSQGTLFDLHWQLRWRDGQAADLRIVDAAGQDLLMLFGQEGVNRMDELSDQLRQIAAYCHNAEVVLLTVNLADFLNERDLDKRVQNQWTIKYALDWLKKMSTPPSTAIVFTQLDLYLEYVKTYGGNLNALVKDFLPEVYAAHTCRQNTHVLGVASVKTVPVVLPDGQMERVPSQGFEPEGFPELVQWIEAQRSAPISEVATAQVSPVKASTTVDMQQWVLNFVKGAISIALPGIVILWVLGSVIHACSSDTRVTPSPIPIVTWQDEEEYGVIHPLIFAKLKVRNDGAEGLIPVRFWITGTDGKTIDEATKMLYLRSGQESDVIELDLPHSETDRSPHIPHLSPPEKR